MQRQCKENMAVANATTKWKKICLRQSNEMIMKGDSKLGVLRIDYNPYFTPIPGDIAEPKSFDYDVIYRVIPGLTFEMCQAGKLTPDVHDEFIEAIEWLQDRNVSAITGDCGFMMNFQKLATEHSLTPVFMSSLAQLPAITYAFQQNALICIVTSSLTSLKPMKKFILETMGIGAHHSDKFIIVGCEEVPGFEADKLKKGENIIAGTVEPGIVDLAVSTLMEYPGIKAFLFECTQLASFSNAVREATGVPVYDAITCCNFFISGFQENQNFGKNKWKQTWSGQRKEYQFGQELELGKKLKLVSTG